MDPITQIKRTIDAISIFEIRNKTIREELNFFFDKLNDSQYLGALIRLNHEIMYLCVDAYSLHEGISKKKSLYSRIIKNNGSKLSKIDKTENYKVEDISYLECFTSSGKRDVTEKEKSEVAKFINEEAIEARKSLQEDSGIKSAKHHDLDQWLASINDDELTTQLHDFRQNFAHRLDCLNNIDRDLDLPIYEELNQCISVVSSVLKNYKSRLQVILTCTNSEYYEGRVGINYDSVSRLKQYKSRTNNQDRKE